MATPLEPKAKRLNQAVLWILLAGLFVTLVVLFGLSFGHELAQRRAQTLEFVRSYQTMSAATPLHAVRVVLAR